MRKDRRMGNVQIAKIQIAKIEKIAKIQIASVILSLGMSLVLAGCSAKSEQTHEAHRETIVIGSDRFEPYVYQNDEGIFTGVDVDLAVEALHRMGYEPEFKQIVWEDKKDYLESHAVDCLWGCFSMNGREEEYQWAGPYLYSSQVVAVRANSEIYQIQDLCGKTVAVQETGKAEEYLLHPTKERVPDVEKVYAFSNMDEVYGALRKNYVEAICGHESALNTFVSTAPEEYRILEESLFSSKLGVAFSRDYDSAFVEELDNTLKQMLEDGTTAQIVETYHLDLEKSLAEGNES